MEQRNENNQGQVTQTGDIHLHAMPCHGPESCPYGKDEAERQQLFEERTGIACSSGARMAFDHLLNSGVFNYRQLDLAHGKKSLWWDWDKHRLHAEESRLDVFYGYTWMVLAAVFFVLILGLLIANHGREPITYDSLLTIAAGVLFLVTSPFAEKLLIRPSKIARRAKPLLDEFYADEQKKSGSSKAL